MGFFLVGRTIGGDLALISPEVFGSRQEALAALTAISADPAFAHRESEVFVGNLDQATPIVLMAPAAAPAAQEPSGEDAVESDEIAEALPEELDQEPSTLDDQPASDAGVWEAPEAEAEAEPEAGEDLAGALKRAAGALESEGIVAPDSIGPEPVVSEAAAAETAWPWDSAPAAESEIVAEVALEPESEDVDEPIAAAVEELAEQPVEELAEAPVEAEAIAEEVAVEPAEESIDSQEPVAEVAAYVPDPFEEPSVDGGDIVSLRADDETVSLGRPVVMGAYSESAFEAVVEPASVAGPGEAEESAEPITESDSDDSDIDSLDGILADLEPIEPVPAGFAGTDSGEPLTCADCVYEQTCPNKEGLDPSQCGNFQWKAR